MLRVKLFLHVGALWVAFAFAGTTRAATLINYSDSTFLDSAWTAVSVNALGNGGTSVGSNSPSGGSPGGFRTITNTINDALPNGNSSVVGVHLRIGAAYNPSIQGAICSIDYSDDSLMVSGGGGGQGGRR